MCEKEEASTKTEFPENAKHINLPKPHITDERKRAEH